VVSLYKALWYAVIVTKQQSIKQSINKAKACQQDKLLLSDHTYIIKKRKKREITLQKLKALYRFLSCLKLFCNFKSGLSHLTQRDILLYIIKKAANKHHKMLIFQHFLHDKRCISAVISARICYTLTHFLTDKIISLICKQLKNFVVCNTVTVVEISAVLRQKYIQVLRLFINHAIFLYCIIPRQY